MFSFKRILSVLIIALISSFALADPVAGKLLAQGRVDDAIVSLQSRISSVPDDAESHNLLCRAYFAVGNWNAGIAACEKAVSLDPGNSEYHLWLGRIYGEKADRSGFLSAASLAKKVRNEFETAVRLNPDNAAARTDLAEFYLDAPGIMGGGTDKAAEQAEKLTSLDSVKAAWVKGRIAEKDKNFVAAENAYRSAVRSNPGRADAWVNLARFYRDHRRFDEMADAIQHVSSAQISQPEVLVDAAQVVIRSGRDLPVAIQLLRRYLSSASPVEEAPVFKAHYLLGTLLEQQGDKREAAEEYRAALSLARNFSRAQDALDRLNHQITYVKSSD
jgi:tetratricopeptide (TPR) repeat protein